MKKIESLTKEQKALLPIYRETWLKHGLNTARANRSVAKQAAKDAYKNAGLDEPKIFIWVDSPIGGCIAAKLIKEISKKYKTFETDQVRDQVWDQVGAQVRDSSFHSEWGERGFWANFEAGAIGFYSFFLEEVKLKCCEKIKPLIILSQEVGLTWFYKNVVILTERPTEIHRNERNRLHNTNGPALKYADGYELYALNGVRLTNKEWVVKQKPEEFTKEQIMGETNADIRREIIRKITPKKALDMLGAVTIHKRDYTGMNDFETHEGRNYELIECDWGTGTKRIYLKMIYPNFGHTIIEAVPPECRTVDQALGFRDPMIHKTEKWKNKDYVYHAPVYLT